MKRVPGPRIPTEKIPERKLWIERGDHLRLYRFSPTAWHPFQLGSRIQLDRTRRRGVTWTSRFFIDLPEGSPYHHLPAQPAVFALDYATEEIAETAERAA